MSDDDNSNEKKVVPLVLMMNTSAGIVMDNEGKLCFNLIDPDGCVIGDGSFSNEMYDVIESQLSEVLNNMGFELPSLIDEISWEFKCKGCGNIVTIPYERFEFDFIKSKNVVDFINRDVNYINLWKALLDIIASCCDMVDYRYCSD